jgi:hypothetical protein
MGGTKSQLRAGYDRWVTRGGEMRTTGISIGLVVMAMVAVPASGGQSAPVTAGSRAKVTGSKFVILPKGAHMTFVDQPKLFIGAVDGFLHAEAPGKM